MKSEISTVIETFLLLEVMHTHKKWSKKAKYITSTSRDLTDLTILLVHRRMTL